MCFELNTGWSTGITLLPLGLILYKSTPGENLTNENTSGERVNPFCKCINSFNLKVDEYLVIW